MGRSARDTGRRRHQEAGHQETRHQEAGHAPVYLDEAHPPQKQRAALAVAASIFAVWLAFLAWLAWAS